MVSHRRLAKRESFPRALAPWVLDSGGYSELSMFGRWVTTPAAYLDAVATYQAEIGLLEWAAPQDWMCEPWVMEKTGLSVREHQERTVNNYLELKASGLPFIPVLQGYGLDDYLACVEMYESAGVDLEAEPIVGLGTMCRRQETKEAEAIIYALQPLRLHGFGCKADGLRRYGDLLTSADSMAWSFEARKRRPGCAGKASCANCLHYALEWRGRTLTPRTQQLHLSAPTPSEETL